MENFGQKLRAIREGKKITLRELGKLAHISHSFIADIESGRSKPSLDTLHSLASALNISVSELVQFQEDALVTSSPTTDNSIDDLPPEALKEIEEFKAFVRHKYKDYSKNKGLGEKGE